MEIFKLLGTIAINTSDAENNLKSVTREANGTSEKLTKYFKKIGGAVATYFAADKIIGFGKECINMASDVEEMENKFNVVFQGMTEEVNAWAENYAESIGRNSNTIKTWLADNQNMFVGMGMTREEGAKLSEQMVSLGLDLASFNNLQEDEAVNALSKALMGETESAKSLGAVLNENTIALAQEQLGYEGKFESLTEAQKMEVRYQAILNQSQDAIGDCERSLDSYKGKTIQLNSAKEKLQETIGGMLLPVMTDLVNVATNVVSALQKGVDWVNEHKTTMEVLAAIIGTVTAAVAAYNIVQGVKAAMNATEAASLTALISAKMADAAATMAALAPYLLIAAAIAAAIAIGVALYKNWDKIKAKAGELASAISEKFDKIKSGITDKINSAKDAVKSAIDKIKGFFDFKWELPKIKMPHFSISGSFSLLPPRVPRISVEWYKNGGIMEDPTLFGLNPFSGKAMVGGEAGAEAIAPIDTLKQYISEAVSKENRNSDEVLNKIYGLLSRIENKPITIVVQSVLDKKVIGETAYKYSTEKARAMGV